ncbi:MAG: hypothetical protein U0872_01285 [Planctomycetaceae bacterium]
MHKKLFVAAACAVSLLSAANLQAEFVLTTTSATGQVYNGSDVNAQLAWVSSVGVPPTPDTVIVTTNTRADSAAGYATITASNPEAELKTVTFTPTDGNLYDAFSFSGILNQSAGGTVYISVQDNQGNAPQTFVVTGLGAGVDIGTLGIVAVSGSGETIKSVSVTSSWALESQNNFGTLSAVPAPPAFAIMGVGALTAGFFFRRQKKTVVTPA